LNLARKNLSRLKEAGIALGGSRFLLIITGNFILSVVLLLFAVGILAVTSAILRPNRSNSSFYSISFQLLLVFAEFDEWTPTPVSRMAATSCYGMEREDPLYAVSSILRVKGELSD
jgi:hypothetical protein